MRYSIDLRKGVLSFIEAGGSKAEAARRFSVSRTTIYQWLEATDPFSPRRWKNRLTIFQTRPSPNVLPTLVSRLFVFGRDCKNSAARAKKALGYKERCRLKRATYRKQLEAEKEQHKTLVYVDESGFQSQTFRRHGYAPKGECV